MMMTITRTIISIAQNTTTAQLEQNEKNDIHTDVLVKILKRKESNERQSKMQMSSRVHTTSEWSLKWDDDNRTDDCTGQRVSYLSQSLYTPSFCTTNSMSSEYQLFLKSLCFNTTCKEMIVKWWSESERPFDSMTTDVEWMNETSFGGNRRQVNQIAFGFTWCFLSRVLLLLIERPQYLLPSYSSLAIWQWPDAVELLISSSICSLLVKQRTSVKQEEDKLTEFVKKE